MDIFKALIDIALLPVAIVKDVVTLGGTMTDEESAIKTSLENLSKHTEIESDDE